MQIRTEVQEVHSGLIRRTGSQRVKEDRFSGKNRESGGAKLCTVMCIMIG
jgi:hypothetical protein